MRHHRNKRKLHRVKRQREALLRALACSLLAHGGITTTVAKAKELRPYVERLVTAGKEGSVASKRAVASKIGGDSAKKLIEVAGGFQDRKGGYTRIVRLGRVGKRAIESARIEFVK